MAVLLQDQPVAALFADFADFVYYAHYVSHDEETLAGMEESLENFRAGVSEHLYGYNNSEFTTPKYHLLQHYSEFVRKFGSLLNGDTEVPERMHVAVKAAYKRTNKKGNWEGQMARNIEEGFLVEQLYQQTQQRPKVKRLVHGRMKGRQVRLRRLEKEQIEVIEVAIYVYIT